MLEIRFRNSPIGLVHTTRHMVRVLQSSLDRLVGRCVSNSERLLRKATRTRALPACLDASLEGRLLVTGGYHALPICDLMSNSSPSRELLGVASAPCTFPSELRILCCKPKRLTWSKPLQPCRLFFSIALLLLTGLHHVYCSIYEGLASGRPIARPQDSYHLVDHLQHDLCRLTPFH